MGFLSLAGWWIPTQILFFCTSQKVFPKISSRARNWTSSCCYVNIRIMEDDADGWRWKIRGRRMNRYCFLIWLYCILPVVHSAWIRLRIVHSIPYFSITPPSPRERERSQDPFWRKPNCGILSRSTISIVTMMVYCLLNTHHPPSNKIWIRFDSIRFDSIRRLGTVRLPFRSKSVVGYIHHVSAVQWRYNGYFYLDIL